MIIFAFVEACCIPISSEFTFAAAGLLAAEGHLNLALVIVIGTLAEMGGSLTSYAVGRRGGRTLLDKYGKWVLVSHSDVDRAERFFAGKGTWIVAVARVLPLVRCFASFGAGLVEIPVAPFAIFSLIGTAVWATALSLIGYSLGGTVSSVDKVLPLALADRHRTSRGTDSRPGRTPAARDQEGLAPPGRRNSGSDRKPEASDPAQTKVGTGRTGGAHRSGRTPSA